MSLTIIDLWFALHLLGVYMLIGNTAITKIFKSNIQYVNKFMQICYDFIIVWARLYAFQTPKTLNLANSRQCFITFGELPIWVSVASPFRGCNQNSLFCGVVCVKNLMNFMTVPHQPQGNVIYCKSATIDTPIANVQLQENSFITRAASWGPGRRKWLFSAISGGIWIKISADKRPLNQLTVKKKFFFINHQNILPLTPSCCSRKSN